MSYKEPRITVSKREFTCKCGTSVKKGDAIFVNPQTKDITCIKYKPKKGGN